MPWLRIVLAQFFASVGLKLWPHVDAFFKRHRILAVILFGFLVAVMVSMLCSCSLVEQKLDPAKFYRRDIQLEINDTKFDGVAVPRKADQYEIKIKAPGKIDMLTIRSCHREEFFEDPSGGLFSSGRSFTYVYKPIAGLEDGRGCLLDIGAYEKTQGRHAWSVVDFETETENIPAIIKCNGKMWNSDPGSVSICQGRSGTLQTISFDHRVKAAPDQDKCKVLTTTDEMNYSYLVPEGECTYYFCDKYGNCHRHTVIGYNEILIRKTD